MSQLSSVGRALAVLDAFADPRSGQARAGTAAEVAARLARDPSQISRVLRTLAEHDLLRRDAGSRRYSASWQVYAEGVSLSRGRLASEGRVALDGLVTDTGQSAYLGVLRGNSTVTILEQAARRSSQVMSWIGRPYPAYCSDAGQALMVDCSTAEVEAIFAGTEFIRHGPNTPLDVEDFLRRLEQTRARGYSVVDEEAEPGLYSIAVPIWDFRGEIVAALQIVGHREQMAPNVDALAEAVRSWGGWLTEALSSTPHETGEAPGRGGEGAG